MQMILVPQLGVFGLSLMSSNRFLIGLVMY